MTFGFEATAQVSPSTEVSICERRANARVRTIYRVAVLKIDSEEGLCRIIDISDGGARVRTDLVIPVGQRLQLTLADGLSVQGRVAWVASGTCGICFDEPFDCLEALHQCYSATKQPGYRSPRLSVDQAALVSGEPGLVPVTIRDVSQRGMKIAHDGNFKPGMRLKVLLGSGRECRGVIRWSTERTAGIWLMDQFAPEELSSAASL